MVQKYTLGKVAEVFYLEPTKEHYLKGISRQIGLAHTSVIKHLAYLKKNKIIIEIKRKRGERSFPFYKANLMNIKFKLNKSSYNLMELKKSGLIEFLSDKLFPKSIVLFGSFTRGEDVEESDIDIFLECKKTSLNLKKFQIRLNRKIELHFQKHFGNYSKELKNNIINGIVLKGFLEAFK